MISLKARRANDTLFSRAFHTTSWYDFRANDIRPIVVVLGFYVPPTPKVIRRRDLGLKSHPKDWRSPGSNSRPLVYKAGNLTSRPQRLLITDSKNYYFD